VKLWDDVVITTPREDVRRTIPMRRPDSKWHVGDLVQVGSARWVIVRLDPASGLVRLEQMNATNAAVLTETAIGTIAAAMAAIGHKAMTMKIAASSIGPATR